MSDYLEIVFAIANALVLPLWGALIFLPRARFTSRLFVAEAPMIVLAIAYAACVIPVLVLDPAALAALTRPTLVGVQALLGSEGGAAAGWIHYLCFDLLVGFSVRNRAISRNESFRWVSPLLALVLMLGPLGWLLYRATSATVAARSRPGS